MSKGFAMTYICPVSKEPLEFTSNGLRKADGALYPFLATSMAPIPDFVSCNQQLQTNNSAWAMYNSPHSAEIYRNFLDWLFTTFSEDEELFRTNLVCRLRIKSGDRVLVTGCGLGEDLSIIAKMIGSQGILYAQDLSKSMVLQAQRNFADSCDILKPNFSVGDALALPFSDGYFDAVFHFGGINLFGNMSGAIQEMMRVTKCGGRIVFGDEGIAPWLLETEYAKVAICNNPLWESRLPLQFLAFNCVDVNCSWVLGNCFYVIDFEVSQSGPHMNIDVPHKGRRGGTARTRYFGQLEGVTPDTKARVYDFAMQAGISVHEWVERTIKAALDR
jgi:SAM-dependent methyltransferase